MRDYHGDLAPLPPPPPSEAARLFDQLTSGRPMRYRSPLAWILSGIRGQWLAAMVALAVTWTALWLLIAGAVITAMVGTIIGVIGAWITQGPTSSTFLLVTLVTNVYAACTLIAAAILQVPALFTSLPTGLLIAGIAFAGAIVGEPITMTLHGYRRMSRRERDRIEPLLHNATRRMELWSVPPVLMTDDGARNAVTHLRYIVLSTTLCNELDDEQLTGILAHELHHWSSADTVGLRFVFDCALPLVLLYNVAHRVASAGTLLAVVARIILWPAWLSVHVVIQPVLARQARVREYAADAAAKAAGLGGGLARALAYLGDFETGRSGWEQVLAATHPPTELRLEALE